MLTCARRMLKQLSMLHSFSEVISWRSEFTTDEDLSGVMDNAGGGPSDWTQEPVASSSGLSNQSNWADFSVFSSHNQLGYGTGCPSHSSIFLIRVQFLFFAGKKHRWSGLLVKKPRPLLSR